MVSLLHRATINKISLITFWKCHLCYKVYLSSDTVEKQLQTACEAFIRIARMHAVTDVFELDAVTILRPTSAIMRADRTCD